MHAARTQKRPKLVAGRCGVRFRCSLLGHKYPAQSMGDAVEVKIENVPAQQIEPDSKFKKYLDQYLKYGFCILPAIFGTKIPALAKGDVKPYHDKKPTSKQHKKWFYSGAKYNLIVMCGKASGNLVGLDFEDPKIAKKIFKSIQGWSKKTLVTRTPIHKGYHIYVRASHPQRSFKIAELALDVQAQGRYVIAAPSWIEETETSYKVLTEFPDSIYEVEGDLEEWLYALIKRTYKDFDPNKYRKAWDVAVLLEGVEEGKRDNAGIVLAT